MSQPKEHILFLVHVEEQFRRHFPDPRYVQRVVAACQSKKYDQVWLLDSDISPIIEEIQNLVYTIPRINWGWGYEPCCFDEEEKQFVIPAHGHEYTWIPPELRNNNYKNFKITVGGGCESECLQDFIDVLNHVGANFQKDRKLIY